MPPDGHPTALRRAGRGARLRGRALRNSDARKRRSGTGYLASRRLACPGGPGWRSALLSLVVNRACGGPGSQALDRSSLTSSGHFPLKDVPVPAGDGEGGTGRGPDQRPGETPAGAVLGPRGVIP